MTLRLTAVVSIFASLFISCAQSEKKVDDGAPVEIKQQEVAVAVRAELKPAGKWKVKGTVRITPTEGGARIVAEVQGLKKKTRHGFHIHEVGDCSDPEFKTAGPHFNPSQGQHGAHSMVGGHAGDLGNLVSDGRGKTKYEILIPHFDLAKTPVVGRSVVIHENEDDLKTQPTGNSGARIACGVFEKDEAAAPAR